MEISRTRPYVLLKVRLALLLFVALPFLAIAQNSGKRYTVKNGMMYIELSRTIEEKSLDSFIIQFDLQDLYLKELVRNNRQDSLLKKGWRVLKANEAGFVLTKPMASFDKFKNPVDRILFSEKHPTFAERFPATNNGVTYGYNRFQSGTPFQQKASVVTFYLRNHQGAGKVMLAGSFNDWKPNALAMKKTDSGWIAEVKLGPGKYWYKFIADGAWMVDNNNLTRENDGYGNINSVLFVTNVEFYLDGYTDARNVYLAGSFNSWRPREIAMRRTSKGWVLPLYLSEGTFPYKFVVDGKWIRDENNPSKMPDGQGDYNSVMTLGQPHLFKLQGFQNAKEVRLLGSFNRWREFELPMNKKGDGWELSYVTGPGNYEYKFWVDGKQVADPANPPAQPGGNSFIVINPNYTFRLKGYEGAKKVFVAGDFNNWNPTTLPMEREGSEWVVPVHLWVGKHVYKFIVDGEWIKDPNNKIWEQNEFGTGNSIVWIDK